MGPKEASRQPVGLRHEHVQDFSDSFSPKVVNRALGGARSGGALAPRATMMPASGSAPSRRVDDASRQCRLRSGLLVALPFVALLVVPKLFVSERSVWAQEDDDLNC
jgi:hypothetical protein